jgi:carbohydrate diacid regulator
MIYNYSEITKLQKIRLENFMLSTKKDSGGKVEKLLKSEKNENFLEASQQNLNTNPLWNTPVFAIIEKMSQAEIEKLPVYKKCETFSEVFEDSELMTTFDAFLNNGMNISETARILYMHRNTLMYRLNKLRDITGLDIKMFDDAVTFAFMRLVYQKCGKAGTHK